MEAGEGAGSQKQGWLQPLQCGLGLAHVSGLCPTPILCTGKVRFRGDRICPQSSSLEAPDDSCGLLSWLWGKRRVAKDGGKAEALRDSAGCSGRWRQGGRSPFRSTVTSGCPWQAFATRELITVTYLPVRWPPPKPSPPQSELCSFRPWHWRRGLGWGRSRAPRSRWRLDRRQGEAEVGEAAEAAGVELRAGFREAGRCRLGNRRLATSLKKKDKFGDFMYCLCTL